MKISPESKITIEKIRLINGSTYEQAKDLFESLLYSVIFNYLENKSTFIPYLGELKVEYGGETILKDGKEAKIKIELIPDYNLKRNIGQLHDKEEPDIRKRIQRKMGCDLEKVIESNK